MLGKASVLFIFLLIEVSWTIANPAVPSEGNQDGPACPLVAGCTSQEQCHEGPAGCSCSVSRPSLLNACHWPKVSEMGSFCGRVGSTPDCSCPHDNDTSDQQQHSCPTVFGCTATSAAQCGPWGNECDVSMPWATEMCHWPASFTGCQAIPGVPDCLCAPGMEHEQGHLPACTTVQGCFTGTAAQCVTPPGGTAVCDMTGAGLMACHWPAADATCTAVAGQPDCDCAPGTLAACTTVMGCTAATTTQCTDNAGTGTMTCDMTAADLVPCTWPALGAASTCFGQAGQPDCLCAPGMG